MSLGRLLGVTFVTAVSLGASIIACGGGGGGGSPSPDAKVYLDAKVFQDAPPAGSAALGHLCPNGAGDCQTAAPDCISTGSAAPKWCTLTCGSTAGSAAPPTGGNAICAAQTGTGGTPVCAFYLPPSGSNTMYTWECGIACGTSGSASLGTCPTGLTCTNNFCI